MNGSEKGPVRFLLRESRALYALQPLLFSLGGGAAAGLILFLVHISNFFSYLSDRPETCMNCHIMGPQYATWQHSAHREKSNCNDCHVPQDNFVRKYLFKALDGLRHSAVFTLRAEPQAIMIKPWGAAAVSENCRRCHAALFARPALRHESYFTARPNQGGLCWHCHRETPHGAIRSLASAPWARVPTTGSMVPHWLANLMAQKR